MKVLSISGGSTKITALAAHGKNILGYYKPDVYIGVSAGSILLLPMILGKHNEIEKIVTNLKFSDFFSKSPVNESGKIKISAYIRGLTTGSFGEMDLSAVISKLVSECEFNDFKISENNVYFGVYNMTLNKFELIHANSLNYEEFILYVTASSAIPVYCKPIKIGDYYYHDGGLKYHNAASYFLINNDIEELVSVYSRPKEDSKVDWGYNGKYIGRNLSKSIDSMINSISILNEKNEFDICRLRNIKLKQHWSPSIMKGVYDINNDRLRLLYDEVDSQYKKDI
jgi:predicted patatin/cPLA2 family phospholipase